jgi:hypothetical protein
MERANSWALTPERAMHSRTRAAISSRYGGLRVCPNSLEH